MADEFKDDEYHFSDQGESEAFDEAAASSPSAISTTTVNHLKKAILGLIGIFIVVLLGYQVLSPKLKGKNKNEENAKADASSVKVVQQQPRSVIQKQSVKPKVVERPKPQASTFSTYTPPVTTSNNAGQSNAISTTAQAKIDSLARVNRRAKIKIGKLTEKLEALEDKNKDASEKLLTLNRNIQLLTEQMMTQQNELKQLKEENAKQKKLAMMKRDKEAPKFYVQAIIPGRAWLMTPQGETVTVAKGVPLKGYGKVVEIKAKEGEVITSSGKTISFSPEDI